jgi:hypothetical protein
MFDLAVRLVALAVRRREEAANAPARASRTDRRSVPSLIAISGRIANRSQIARTSGQTTIREMSSRSPMPAASAISSAAPTTPHSVASCIPLTPRSRRPNRAAVSASSTVLMWRKSLRPRSATSFPAPAAIRSVKSCPKMPAASSAAVFVM